MATSNIKKNAEGYGYKYTDLAEIHNYLEANGMRYYQTTETVGGVDYIITIPIIDGKEMPPRRGCRVAEAKLSGKSNPAQEQGSAITYARRYSLLMAFGLATTDDDAACLTEPKSREEMFDEIKSIIKAKGLKEADVLKKIGIESLAELDTERMPGCITWLKGMK